MSNIDDRKNDALEAISRLFSDTDADEQDQIDALEEIKSLASDNIEVLEEQIRSRAQ